ncbi:hypothetical protein EYZ11_013372 [Aspergillus tanneri]|uniref:Putative gamma-glutamylcyclotransferase n=1 Tax=Aspergillus tanneri TaxID=1220188 RepID=A0A4S3IXX7_9EURO|nr:uncharacterized protein ATNIH1004_001665 [Aspergillus tanneri]KAA8652760.1 hypothetical protein ATNIH1004_001665 [Aspergillus tanneri]THC87183.1 hypothetical protein EYZ11_013372 [Aspergillus tanneri]
MSTPPGRDTKNDGPPPPPPAEDPRSKISPFVLKLRSAPPNYYYQAPKPSPIIDLLTAPTGPYFFYGTLTDPSMIAEILNLEKEPELRPAFILGYKCRMWGQYPALVDAPGSIVEGAVYLVRTAEDGEKLAAYETRNYCTESCLIRYSDNKGPSQDLGYTFKFAGNPNDLSEGTFDLRTWLKMMGRQTALDKLDAKKHITY